MAKVDEDRAKLIGALVLELGLLRELGVRRGGEGEGGVVRQMEMEVVELVEPAEDDVALERGEREELAGGGDHHAADAELRLVRNGDVRQPPVPP